MPDRLSIDEFLVAMLASNAPLDPSDSIALLRELRMHLSRAAEFHDPDLTLDDDLPLATVAAISFDAIDLERLDHESHQ